MDGYEMTRRTGAKNTIIVIAFFLLFSSSAMAAGDLVKAGTIFLNGTGIQIASPICSGSQVLSTTPTGVFQCVAVGGSGNGVTIPAANVTAGTFGTGNFVFPTGMNVTGNFNASGLLFVNSTNVGIGTTNPAQKLDVVGLGKFGTNSFVSIGDLSSVSPKNYVNFGANNDAAGIVGFNTYIAASGGALKYANTHGSITGAAIVFRGNTETNINNLEFYTTATASTADTAFGSTIPTLTLSSGGNVGIGTTSPGTILDIKVAGTGNSITAATTNAAIRINDTGSGANSRFGIAWQRSDSPYTIAAIEPEVAVGWPTALKFFTNTDGATQLTEKLRIAASGLIGINTTAPAALLHINGNTFLNGSVGIGTASPATNLEILGAPVANVGNLKIIDNTAMAAGVGGQITLGGYFNAGSTTPGVMISAEKTNAVNNDYSFDLAFSAYKDLDASMTERMRINGSTGNVGIGTTSPNSKLSVVTDNFDATTYPGIFLTGYQSSTTASVPLVEIESKWTSSDTANIFQVHTYDDNAGFNIRATGKVGINTTAPAALLHVNGNTFLNGSVGIGTASPGQALDVNGDINSRLNTRVGTSYSRYLLVKGSNNPGAVTMQVANTLGTDVNDSSVPLVLQPYAGNVGIGTTAPTKKFQVVDSSANITLGMGGSAGSNTALRLGNAGNVFSEIIFAPYESVIPNSVTLKGSSYGLSLQTMNESAKAAMNIGFPDVNYGAGLFVNGSVGIGTTSSTSTLNVLGTTSLNGTLSIIGNSSQSRIIDDLGVVVACQRWNGTALVLNVSSGGVTC